MSEVSNRTSYVSDEVSLKIQGVSFVASIMVVMIHSQAFLKVANFPELYKSILEFIFQDLTAWAVPWFFTLSGFFFFQRISSKQKDNLWTTSFWRQFYLSKLRSLVCPYVVWTIICTLLLLPITIGANYVNGRELFDLPVRQGSVIEFVVDVFGVTNLNGPQFAGHLWFLRSLIILFFIAPLLTCFVQLNLMLKTLLLSFLFGLHLYNYPYVICVFWFLLGDVLLSGLFKCRFTTIQKFVFLMGCLGCLVGAFWTKNVWGIAQCLKISGVVLGIAFMVGVVNLGRDYDFIKPTFFYYCSHLIFTTWTMFGLLFSNRTSIEWSCCVTIITVMVGIVGPFVLYKCFFQRWRFPWMNILSGGRG